MMDLSGVISSLFVISFLSILLNGFCIYIIITSHQFRKKPSSVFILNLLVIHLFQGVFVYPSYAGKKLDVESMFWKQFFTDGFLFTYILSYYGVCLGILKISIDRFLATYLLNTYKLHVTFRNVSISLSISWIYTGMMSLIPFIPETTNTSSLSLNTSTIIKDINNTALVNCLNYSAINNTAPSVNKSERSYNPQDEWTVFMLFVNGLLPLTLIIMCYLYIISRLKKLDSRFGKHISAENCNKDMCNVGKLMKLREFRKYKEVTHLTLMLSIAYSIFWSPSVIYYNILSMCESKCFPEDWDNSPLEKHIVYIIKYLSFGNSLISPLAYCFHHPELKRRFSSLKYTLRRHSAVKPKKSAAYQIPLHTMKADNNNASPMRSVGFLGR